MKCLCMICTFIEGTTESSQHFNGAVEAATTLTGAFLAFIMGFMHFNWSLIGETTIAVISSKFKPLTR